MRHMSWQGVNLARSSSETCLRLPCHVSPNQYDRRYYISCAATIHTDPWFDITETFVKSNGKPNTDEIRQ